MIPAALIFPITVIVLMILGGGLVVTFILLNMRAHELTLYEVLGDGRSIEKKYKMLERMSKKSQEMVWISVPWQKKVWVEAPKTENVNMTDKGKKAAHARIAKKHEKGMIEVVWLRPDIIGNLNFKPLSHSAKNTIRNEYTEAYKERNEGFSFEKLAKAAFTGAVLVIIVMGLIMAPDIMGKVNSIQSTYLEWTSDMKEIQARQAQIMEAIGADLEGQGLEVKLVQTLKQQQGDEVNVTEQGE